MLVICRKIFYPLRGPEDPVFFQVVRRLAVSSTNAAGQYKPYLIVNQLSSLMPMIYAETQVKPELIREYQMGPFVGEHSIPGNSLGQVNLIEPGE
jgi:hypothetical protein